MTVVGPGHDDWDSGNLVSDGSGPTPSGSGSGTPVDSAIKASDVTSSTIIRIYDQGNGSQFTIKIINQNNHKSSSM